ncbi:alpha/beta hydrolase [Fructilactobacillus fructivorans]|uniref:Alpha/beta hydrolase fold domain-containing protein n=1 Tax=Fructilactobacillus fructivorans TaxID=1614 RepID=A0AAE6P1A7_9LACO|nr:alpha/beta hydrolase [Fructilactobacillus fructivorans]KRK56912.1 esterase lipase [Fructilactobacillus fructivorans]KRN41223.1 esterase lipase [Fructilactobacillus fructivorans]KRN43038.1 esterase lipase [Fructilactobacillus fructivorans]QFX93236.1 alpha/beta hydrolase fold domain-containing protein [Fructilactobacillus fructivorans]RDV65056.1 alpha/beta hydrolase [Fructilactobacillus fructivorans]
MVKFIEREHPFSPADTDFVERKFIDIPYAEGERHKLDIYLPNEKRDSYPVIIDVHGGGMYFGQKSSFKLNGALELLKRGYAVVSPNYSLSYMKPFPTAIYELKAVVRFVKAHADSYHFDSNAVFMMGESSGAQLAMLLAASEASGHLESDFGSDFDYSSQVNGVISSYGLYDMALLKPEFEALGQVPNFKETGDSDSFEGAMLGFHRPVDVPDLVAEADPTTYLNEAMVPALLYAGTGDRVVPYVQTINMAAELIKFIGKQNVEVHIIDGVPHGPSGFMNETVFDQKDQFMRRVMKQNKNAS